MLGLKSTEDTRK